MQRRVCEQGEAGVHMHSLQSYKPIGSCERIGLMVKGCQGGTCCAMPSTEQGGISVTSRGYQNKLAKEDVARQPDLHVRAQGRWVKSRVCSLYRSAKCPPSRGRRTPLRETGTADGSNRVTLRFSLHAREVSRVGSIGMGGEAVCLRGGETCAGQWRKRK